MKDKQVKLMAEFPAAQVTFRPGTITKDKKKGLPLAYIDARDVMGRLDDVLGIMMWKDEYEFHGSRSICKLSIFDTDGKEWVTKCDGAGDTNIEGEKGGLSDAFKRAAVKWGIGRYLYDLEFRYHPIDDWKKFVGDPWQSQIKGKKPAHQEKNKEVIDTPKETPKPAKVELTPEETRGKAEKWTNDYMVKVNDCQDKRDLQNLQVDEGKPLGRLFKQHPTLAKVASDCCAAKMASFDKVPSPSSL